MGSFDRVIPLINSIRLYTDYYPDRSPSSFGVSGSDSNGWIDLLTLSGQTYTRYSWKQWSLNSPSLFKSINFTVNYVQSTEYAWITELQFMTCNQHTILPSLSFFFIHQSISLTIDMNGAYNCIITPSLPEGLTLNPSSCSISGSVSSFYSSIHTIIATSGSIYLSRPISIQIDPSFFLHSHYNITIAQGVYFNIILTQSSTHVVSLVSGSIPEGLTIHSNQGISGIPTQTDCSYSSLIEVMRGSEIDRIIILFTLITPISSFYYPQSSYSLLSEPFSITPFINGDNPSFSITSGSLPSGLSLNPDTGVISGIPSQSVSSQSVTIKATNEVSSLSFILSFTVRTQLSSFSYSQSHFILTRYHPFSTSPSINGYNPSYSVQSGSLPQGLSLDSDTGVISGIPSQSVSSISVIIKATNEISSISFSISFSVQFISSFLIYPHSSYSLSSHIYFSTAPIMSGDQLSFNITSGSLPQGLILDATTGKISGIPSIPSDFMDVTIQASNQVGSIQTQLFFMVNSLSTTTIILISLIVALIIISIISITSLILVILMKGRNRKTLPKIYKHRMGSSKSLFVSKKGKSSKSVNDASDKAMDVVVGLSFSQTDFKSL